MAAPAIIFLMVLGIIFGAYWIFILRPEQMAEQRVRARLKGPHKAALRTSLLKARERLSNIGSLDSTLSRAAMRSSRFPISSAAQASRRQSVPSSWPASSSPC
jgi:hypothetical protein